MHMLCPRIRQSHFFRVLMQAFMLELYLDHILKVHRLGAKLADGNLPLSLPAPQPPPWQDGIPCCGNSFPTTLSGSVLEITYGFTVSFWQFLQKCVIISQFSCKQCHIVAMPPTLPWYPTGFLEVLPIPFIYFSESCYTSTSPGITYHKIYLL